MSFRKDNSEIDYSDQQFTGSLDVQARSPNKINRRRFGELVLYNAAALILTACEPIVAAAKPANPEEQATDAANSKSTNTPTEKPPATATTTKEPVLPTQTTRPITETSEPTKVVETPRSQAVEAGYHAEYLAKNYEYVEAGEYTQGGKQYEAIYGIKPTGEKVLISLKMSIGESEPQFYPADEWQGKDGLKGTVVFRFDGYHRQVHPKEISGDSIMEKLFASVSAQHKIDPETLQDRILTNNGQLNFMAPFQVLDEWAEKWEPVNANVIDQPVVVWQVMNAMPSDFPPKWKDTWFRMWDNATGMRSPYGAMINADSAGQMIVMTKNDSGGGVPFLKEFTDKSDWEYSGIVKAFTAGMTSVVLKYPELYKGPGQNGKNDVYKFSWNNGHILTRKPDPQYEIYVLPDK